MKTETPRQTFDVVIVGAGFAGLYQLYCTKQLGLTARVLEAGSGIGGTWFWNRYPGARCDVESFDYSYSFSKELEQDWNWSERYAPQPEILQYINHVADRFNLRQDIQLNTRVASATYDEATNKWVICSTDGEVFESQFCIMATGCLSIPIKPNIKGIDTFRGELYYSSQWPHKLVDFKDKTVGLIGTGSSGVQMAPIIAEQAAHLNIFQRTANFSVPSQNEHLSEEQISKIKAHYGERRALGREAVTGHYLDANSASALDVSDEDRRARFEHCWRGAGGGFRMLRAFSDLMSNKKSNEYVSQFIASKIRETVRDPAIAETLVPKSDLPFGTKRLCVDSGYFETFNRDNVTLVDVKANPIQEITTHGLRTNTKDFSLDILILATGFDAMTGALMNIDIKGRDGLSLRDKWQYGPRTYVGLAVAGFPNMFMITGPGSPSVLSNMVHSIETHANWIRDCINYLRSHKNSVIEANTVAEEKWVEHVNEVASRTLYPTSKSWFTGANIPGKPRVFMPYLGGVPAYRRIIEGIAEKDYEGFSFT